MVYFLWFIISILAFVWMHYFTELSKRNKWLITSVVTLIVANAALINFMNNKEGELAAAAQLKFENNETLVCGDMNITAKEFSYSVGTQSFVGNKGSKYASKILSASECR